MPDWIEGIKKDCELLISDEAVGDIDPANVLKLLEDRNEWKRKCEDAHACLAHAIELGHLNPEGSTGGWAKSLIEEKHGRGE